jgi:integrase
MAIGKITADTLNALHPREVAFFLWDDKLPGFGVKVTPKGAKVYILQYRMGGRGHKTRRYTIGKEGQFRPASARKEAERLLGEVRRGNDIAAQVREEKRVAVDLAFTPYVEEFCTTRLKADWPKSWKQTHQCLKLHACRHLGDQPLPAITSNDVRRLLRRLDGQPATRRNLFAALSYLFNKSVKDGVIAKSPLVGIDPPSPVPERDRSLSDDELQWLWSALSEESQPYRGLVEDLILTGQRRGEVAGLPWNELSRERREWHLPARRAKNGCENVIPLTDALVARFDKLAGGEKWPKLGLVYPSREGTAVTAFSKLKRRLDKRMTEFAKQAGGELEPWKVHDLRRTLATRMQRLGVQHEVVEHLLNHREKSRTGIAKVYQTHDYKPEKLAALERWQKELDRIFAGKDAVVIPFERRA